MKKKKKKKRVVNLDTLSNDIRDMVVRLGHLSEHCDKVGKKELKALCKRLDGICDDIDKVDTLVKDLMRITQEQLDDAEDKIRGLW